MYTKHCTTEPKSWPLKQSLRNHYTPQALKILKEQMSSQLSHRFSFDFLPHAQVIFYDLSLSYCFHYETKTKKREHRQVKRSTLFFGAVFLFVWVRSYALKEWEKKSFQKQKKESLFSRRIIHCGFACCENLYFYVEFNDL